jgi:hypothetical protein
MVTLDPRASLAVAHVSAKRWIACSRELGRTAPALALAVLACSSRLPRDVDDRAELGPAVRDALSAEREAFVRGDVEAALRASGLDTVHWSAVRQRADTAVQRRTRLVALGHDYHSILSASEHWDSVRVTAERAMVWVSAYTVYAHRKIDGDTTAPRTMGEEEPHVLTFARRSGRWVLVRDSIVSMAELHRHTRVDSARAVCVRDSPDRHLCK